VRICDLDQDQPEYAEIEFGTQADANAAVTQLNEIFHKAILITFKQSIEAPNFAAERQARGVQLRPVFEELSGYSARAAARELNPCGVPTAAGSKWHAMKVIRVRERL
jgi:hypothetical protein